MNQQKAFAAVMMHRSCSQTNLDSHFERYPLIFFHLSSCHMFHVVCSAGLPTFHCCALLFASQKEIAEEIVKSVNVFLMPRS